MVSSKSRLYHFGEEPQQITTQGRIFQDRLEKRLFAVQTEHIPAGSIPAAMPFTMDSPLHSTARMAVSNHQFHYRAAHLNLVRLQEKDMRSSALYSTFAKSTARHSGRPGVFVLAVLIIILWIISGPFFHYSDTWQLVINTGTTIVTFLMVFLIQNTQNRDTEAIQIKLDELIRATKGAHNSLLDLEELEESTLNSFRKRYEALAAAARAEANQGHKDTGSPDA